MHSYPLIAHPSTPAETAALKIWVNVSHSAAFGRDATVDMTFCVGAPASRFTIPTAEDPSRRDELWKATCFEAFLRPDGLGGYTEWNFAPSGDWASYSFEGPRAGMQPAEVAAPPYIRLEDNLTWWAVGATIAVPADLTFQLGLTAVLEERDGSKSYWALDHGNDAPDFHDPSCFLARLPG
ncbi:DOMON-like domain-containing protein [Sphingomonas rhizophila]|uniref:DOMON-like domain-containing protein n=1 Tax=Sphingomonas rhizophila TaxID=2071607 RepID=A0A7G9SD97_9SPHN|nr:DOMON-like domain-containing protein [Sphingomonas rhizophila]QNN65822.1 DOMON-like domain-containing protein [Sphingomonas rhizophila]